MTKRAPKRKGRSVLYYVYYPDGMTINFGEGDLADAIPQYLEQMAKLGYRRLKLFRRVITDTEIPRATATPRRRK